MLHSIYERIVGAFTTARRRKPHPKARRLSLESLENRKLLTATVLTVNSISDGNFAAPALTPGAYQVAPGSTPWQYAGNAGVSTNNSDFTRGDPRAPVGTQVAYIKDSGSISQVVSLDAGVYNLSLLAAQRINYQTQPQVVAVLVDGAQVGAFQPNTPIAPATTTAYSAFQSMNFTVTQGLHTIELLGLTPNSVDSTVFVDEVAISPVVDGMVDGGFEEPALPLNAYAPDSTGSAWQFSGQAGIAKNGSNFVTNWTTAQNAPAGSQVAYLQGTGSMSQTVFLDAGTYQLDFLAAQRQIVQASYQEVEVLVDGTPSGIVNPVNTLYGSYSSTAFTVATGPHTFSFVGLDPIGGDNTVFIDQVSLSTNGIVDGGFETPQLAKGASQAAPTGSPWVYSGSAGVAHNGSSVTTNNPNSPDGLQVAYIKNGASISQSVGLVAGSYTVLFAAAQQASNQNQQIDVLVDGTAVGVITPVGTGYKLYETPNFTISLPGSHTVTLLGLSPASASNTALIDEVSLVSTNDLVLDGGFETPALPSNSYQVAPANTPWHFTGAAGISTNGSGITSGNNAAPQGTQIGFVQNGGSMTYTTYLDANTYSLSFYAAQRVNSQSQSQTEEIEVLLDGAQIGLLTPSSTTYYLYDSNNFTVTAGAHSIEFLGINPSTGTTTALIDGVTLTAVQNEFIDGGFATPVQATAAFQIAPGGSAWSFTGTSGVAANGSGFVYVPGNFNNNGYTYHNINSPQGVQVAFLKDNATISQTIDLDAGTYSIGFLASQRIVNQTQNQQFEVLVDNNVVGTFTPATLAVTSGSNVQFAYTPYQTSNFTVTAGSHAVEFLGLAPATADSTALIDSVTLFLGGGISNGSFEAPALTTGTFQVAPTGTAWQFTGDTGVTTNNSPFNLAGPNAPDGVQAAFLKGTGTISQSVYLAAGFYNISYEAAQRDQDQSSYQSIEVLVDGVVVGTATPAKPPFGTTKTSYGLYNTSNFTVAAGMHTIEFLGLNPQGGDNTAFIDNVTLNI
jgi:hypothetical protein